MRIAVLGNGASGLFSAFELVEQGHEVVLIGPADKYGSASYTAGLMLNVYSEVDCINYNSPLTQLKLESAQYLFDLWDKISNSGQTPGFESYSNAKGTEVKKYEKGNAEFEINSFNKMEQISLKDTKKNGAYKSNGKVFLPQEKHVNARVFLNFFCKEVSQRVSYLDNKATGIEKLANGKLKVNLATGEPIYSDRAVVCSGAFSGEVVASSYFSSRVKVNSLFGVGSALLLSSDHSYIPTPELQGILRTPNRGGTCGVHAVPCGDKLYVGASSFVSRYPIVKPQASSVLALLRGAEEFLNLELHKLSIEVLTGFRPLSDDMVPVIGAVDDNVFLMYGGGRDGFTWAPHHARIVSNWAEGKTSFGLGWLKLCNPLRSKYSFINSEPGYKLYEKNKKGSYAQHGKQVDSSKLKDIYQSAHSRVEQGYMIHPDLVNYYHFEYNKI